jgi:hypothetical protein
MTLNTPEQIAFARLAALKGALKLELAGLQVLRGRTAYSILRDMGYKGTRERVLAQVTADVEAQIKRAQEAKRNG